MFFVQNSSLSSSLGYCLERIPQHHSIPFSDITHSCSFAGQTWQIPCWGVWLQCSSGWEWAEHPSRWPFCPTWWTLPHCTSTAFTSMQPGIMRCWLDYHLISLLMLLWLLLLALLCFICFYYNQEFVTQYFQCICGYI